MELRRFACNERKDQLAYHDAINSITNNKQFGSTINTTALAVHLHEGGKPLLCDAFYLDQVLQLWTHDVFIPQIDPPGEGRLKGT